MATNIYLVIPGITGPSTTQGYLGAFQVNSLGWGVSTPVTITGGGAGAGKPSLSSVSVQLPLGQGSMPLLVNLASGNPVKSASIYLVKTGSPSGVFFERYDLTNVFFSSYQTSVSGDQPADMLTLVFQKIKITYYSQKADGTTAPTPEVFTWDVSANRP